MIFSLFSSEISLLFPAICPTFWDYQSLLFTGKPVEALLLLILDSLISLPNQNSHLSCNDYSVIHKLRFSFQGFVAQETLPSHA